jgi:hypothetical protein
MKPSLQVDTLYRPNKSAGRHVVSPRQVCRWTCIAQTSLQVDMLYHPNKSAGGHVASPKEVCRTCCITQTYYSDLTSLCSFSLVEKQQIPILVFGLTRVGLEPTIYSTGDKPAYVSWSSRKLTSSSHQNVPCSRHDIAE